MLLGNASVDAKRDFHFTIYKVAASLFAANESLRKEKSTAERKIHRLNGNRNSRIKRSDGHLWIKSEIDGTDDFLEMHAFVVRDEDIPECDTPADKVAKGRYFMCSGVILDERHVLTSATCMNQAHIHKYHTEAYLAVLIGALGVENSYVIKIAHYEIHPRYVPDPNSIRHATNNIAVLRLSCPIPRKYVVVPKLPSKRFQDIAHLCCPGRCKLSTVIKNSENQRIIRLITLKHLPSAMHIDIKRSNVKTDEKSLIKLNLPRIGKTEQDNTNKFVPLASLGGRSVRQSIYGLKATNFTDSSRNSKSIAYSSQKVYEVIDWHEVKTEIDEAKVSRKNQKLLSDFVQASMSEVLTKLLEVMTNHITDMNKVLNSFASVLQENVLHGENSYEKISDFIGKNILKFALEKMSIIGNNCTEKCRETATSDNLNVENHVGNKKAENNKAGQDGLHTSSTAEAVKDNKTEMSKKGENKMKINEIGEDSEKSVDLLHEDKYRVLSDNAYCPPLGSPVVVNKTLVALIAYTCHDVQNWVEWKYVNVNRNVRWIRKELRRNLTEELNLSNTKDKKCPST
ncbi:uncharacterized protein LOC131663570 [Phymastichus coffea]|uniref:uncharacterized protein LOC131663570 n=1 Tax=Phymastichus coffea TaxID=108790 RepID=UPI00273C0DFB|nr:uncharacterized protein LOC131663570 [Phymastichus coffea]